MAKTILCCVSDSAHARKAIELAVELAKALGRDLTFLLINPTRPASGHPPIKALDDKEVSEILNVAVRYAHTHGAGSARPVLIKARDVATAILDYAADADIEHIVVGTGNPPFIGRLLLGSISAAIVAKATCSVTVAR